mmetsp:Transcript_32671/g.101099  ORF Transcript_32671/g.101099 Transcript_32671/m.101099 type:complete len:184 (-) Transcript_32671:24-575(-)
MSFLCCCCRGGAGGDDGGVEMAAPSRVTLDTRGPDVLVDKGVVGGEGIARASTAIEQDAAYWEIRVEAAGDFRLGVCRGLKGGALSGALGDGEKSWALAATDAKAAAGDVIGVAFGQAELPNLTFFLNGEALEAGEVTRIRGEVFPAVSVAGGARVACVFDERSFKHAPPRGHSALRVVQSLI